jgi:hypothetical protein
MRILSKSKLLAYRQCPRRLWLGFHKAILCEDANGTQASFAVSNRVVEIARNLYDPKGKGKLTAVKVVGFPAAYVRTLDFLAASVRIFEAGFCAAAGGTAFADTMLPARKPGMRVWRMAAFKSSSSVRGYHRDAIAISFYRPRSLAAIRLSVPGVQPPFHSSRKPLAAGP